MTVIEVLTAAVGYLKNHGVESPRLNAEHLLAHALGKKRLDLYLEFDRPLSDAERAPFRDLIRDRGKGKPLQHLLGTVEFFGRSFLSDHRALVPRPETEQLVELAIQTLRNEANMTILDVGTGSGVVAITLAFAFPLAMISATDVSLEALTLARENALQHSVRIDFHEADLFPAAAGSFDAIVANLPYIASDELVGLQREVRHDPPTALDGGPDGLRHIRKLIDAAPDYLAPEGILFLEIGHNQAAEVSAQLATLSYRDIRVRKDYQDVERFVTAVSPRRP